MAFSRRCARDRTNFVAQNRSSAELSPFFMRKIADDVRRSWLDKKLCSLVKKPVFFVAWVHGNKNNAPKIKNFIGFITFSA